jgi:hypothetical protein
MQENRHQLRKAKKVQVSGPDVRPLGSTKITIRTRISTQVLEAIDQASWEPQLLLPWVGGREGTSLA